MDLWSASDYPASVLSSRPIGLLSHCRPGRGAVRSGPLLEEETRVDDHEDEHQPRGALAVILSAAAYGPVLVRLVMTSPFTTPGNRVW
jgi:hypothetical protein